MRVAIYVRVSTEEQAEEGYSIKAQIDRLNAYATSQDWKVVKTYIDDGESAKDMKRTHLSIMLDDLKEDIFDCVLVYRLDRLTRSVLDLYTMLNLFEKYNVKFKSATEVYDTTTAMGRLFITLVAALAQWERENLGERVRMGMTQKAKEGKWTVSVPPFGYDKDANDGDYLVINEKEATIVKEIFEYYTSGKYGVGKIAKMLNLRGIKTKSLHNWNTNTVRYVLTNPIYVGTMRYNYRVNTEQYFEIKNTCPVIIKQELFDEANSMLSSRSKKHPRKATSPYIFTSVLKCARCGGSMAGKQASGRNRSVSYNYYCVNHRYGTCDLPLIAQNYLEIQFMKEIRDLNYKNVLSKELNNHEQPKQDDIENKIKNIQKELKDIEQRRSKWQYAWMNNLISDSDLKKRNKEEKRNESQLKIELEKIEQNSNADVKKDILGEMLENIEGNWNNLDLYEKKKLVEMSVSGISVDKIFKGRTPDSVELKNIDFI